MDLMRTLLLPFHHLKLYVVARVAFSCDIAIKVERDREFDMRFTLIKCHFLFDLAIKQPHLQMAFCHCKIMAINKHFSSLVGKTYALSLG